MWKWMKAYTSFIYNRPWVVISIALLATTIMTVILVLHFGLHPTANTNYYRWSGDPITDRWDAYVGAGKHTYGSLLGMFAQTMTMPVQFQMTQMGALIYERPNQNILESGPQRAIWEMENAMHAVPGWSDHCLKIPLDSMPPYLRSMILDLINSDSMQAKLSELENDTKCIAFKSITTEYRKFLRDQKNISNPTPDDLTEAMM
jgi:hypothetical protein